MLKKWVCAVNSGIVDDIIACYCVDASLFATFDEKPLKSREDIRNYFLNFTSKEGAGVCIDEASTSLISLDDSFYLATGLYEFYFRKDINLVRHPARFTFIVEVSQKEKIIHHHSSLVPKI